MNDRALAGLPPEIVLDEVVPARAPWDHLVRAGETLRIIDLEATVSNDVQWSLACTGHSC